jgi:hypothetical protein
MNKQWVIILSNGALVFALVFAGTGFAKSNDNKVIGGTIRIENQVEADLPALAKLTLDQAVHNALAAVQGKILKAELENENGFLVYGVEVVAADKSIVDVKVDAGTGKLLAMDRDKVDDKDHGSSEHGNDLDHED